MSSVLSVVVRACTLGSCLKYPFLSSEAGLHFPLRNTHARRMSVIGKSDKAIFSFSVSQHCYSAYCHKSILFFLSGVKTL